MNLISIIVVESNRLIRSMFNTVLSSQPGFIVVGCTGGASEAISFAAGNQPDILLLNINLPGLNAAEFIEIAKLVSPVTRTVAILAGTPLPCLNKMLTLEANGYLTNSTDTDEIIKAIREVSNGGFYLCRDLRTVLTGKDIPVINNISPYLHTSREMEVVRLLKQNLSSGKLQ